MGASLPTKEANLFKLIVKSYETKQYKKGLKAADAILKKFPSHGDREYREAIKCYRNALRIDPDNLEILRDLSLLQAQMRDLSGFVETRQQLLTLKPNHRMNWIGFAVSQHLNSNASKAVEILEAFEGTLEDDYPPENELCEHTEMILYKVSLLEESGAFDKALEELHRKESKIVDKLSYKEQEVSLLSKLGRLEEAKKLYRVLLSINPDNYRYYEGLQKCLELYSENGQYSSDQMEKLNALYQSLSEQYTRSSAVKRIPLDFLQDESFKKAVGKYIKPLLTKGVPSLFSDLSSLYDHPRKPDILEQLLIEMENSIRTTGSYPGSDVKEPPSTLLWTLFFLAQHYDKRGQYDVALGKIDEAIAHTPTVIDLYSVKSRIMKHAGDLTAAAALADEARCMDLADRYINSECVKRMLQANQVALAEKIAVLFTKEGDQINNLHDMQCMWYDLASGDSYFRQGDLGRALKKFLAVEKHYSDIHEDQFDFHSYCLRKMTLRSYVDMLKFQDRLHSFPYFHKAAVKAIRCYLKLHDSPKSTAEEDEMSKLASAQKKKIKKQKKAEARAKKVGIFSVLSSELTPWWLKSGLLRFRKLRVEEPMAEASKYLRLLQKHSPNSLETHLLSFEVNMRKQKFLLAFQAVKQLLKLDAENPDSHRSLIKFFLKTGSTSAPTTEAEKLRWSVLEAERPSISQLQNKSLGEANKEFLARHGDSLVHRAAYAEMLYLLDPSKKTESIKIIEDSTNEVVQLNGALGLAREWKLKDCIAVHKLLDTVLLDSEAASSPQGLEVLSRVLDTIAGWKARCTEYFPCSTYFEGKRSSVMPDSVYNSSRKSNENGDTPSHPMGQTELSDGQLEALKSLSAST
ncbi:hypothetical protein F2Q69_00051932 [Brassica cretica]|uniref:Uncharacterized protein n=1 Tax=Brassica cretica TaxID=69181 RepID=A0A8S9PHE2_BRACR|nr:hypothetical protein F2Q69_00051932 [Brassica cretica]